jgi:glycosyltransferase involved in cell wall biosynthesis
MKTIFYDARHWRKGGIGEVIRVHLTALEQDELGIGARVWVLGADLVEARGQWPRLTFETGPAMFTVGEQFAFARMAWHADLVLCPYLTFPLCAPTKVIIWVHDFIWIKYPRYASSKSAWLYFLVMQAAAHLLVERKVYISQFTRDAAKSLFGRADGIVLHNPVRAVRQAGGRKQDGSVHLLYIGNWKKWKRVPLLVEAFRKFRTSHPGPATLTLIGGAKTNNDDDVKSLIVDEVRKGSIRDLGYVDEAVWAVELAACDIIVMPSEVEGFGLPVMEGLATGKRVIAGKGTVAEELAGSWAMYFDRHDAESLAAAIAAAVAKGAPDAAEQDAMRAHARDFLADRHAQRFRALLHQQLTPRAGGL